MRKVLIDINVVLDVLLDRKPHVNGSAAVWTIIEKGDVEGLLAAHAVTTLHYLIRKEHGSTKSIQMLSSILKVFGVATIDELVIEDALRLALVDFEDSVTVAAARRAECALIVTRDPKGFRGSPIRIIAPEAAVPLLKQAD